MSAGPSVTVLITAHDAAAAIGPCLRSIAAQRDLPEGGFEIVLVDDRSTDGTSEAALALGLADFRLIRVEAPSGSGLTTRQDALALGIRAARGDIVLTTDADGIVGPDWVAGMTRPIREGMADAVAGPVFFRAERGGLGFWQTVDVAYYLALCGLLDRAGFAGGVLFGNFAFRRELFEAVGGFERIGFTLTEDLAFSRALHRHGACIRYGSDGPVEVAACESWSVLIERAKRVSSGGFSALAVTLGTWMTLLPVLAVLAAMFGGVFAWLLAARYAAGVLFCGFALLRARRLSLLPLALLYEPLAFAIGLRVMASLSHNSRVEWGGKNYAR
jgi:cellulose synthase/poly-beta-1,6-N-acetylglucosamine synthase-like glycosyltransferase